MNTSDLHRETRGRPRGGFGRLARLLITLTAGLAVAAVGLGTAAHADTVPNDSFANATVISSLPFSTTEDTSLATSDPSDPLGCSNNGSVWFSFTPSSDMRLEAYALGSTFDGTVLSAWTVTE